MLASKAPKCLPGQEKHVETLEKILMTHHCGIDASEAGAGKTHTTSIISYKHNRPLMVIGPSAMTWNLAINRYGLKTSEFPFMTYESFRYCKRNSAAKHGLFQRNDEDYIPLEKAYEIADKEYLIVFDECQILKNRGATFSAVKVFLDVILSKKKAWVLFLSATLIDKETQVSNLLHLLGFISSTSLYTNYFGRLDDSVKEELFQWILKTSRAEEFKQYNVIHPFVPKAKVVKKYLFDLFINFIKPEILSIMPKAKIIEKQYKNASLDVKNGFYKMDRRNEIRYIELLKNLKHIIGDKETMNEGAFKNFTKMLIDIQRTKVESMVRIIKRDLSNEEKNYKIIVYSNYKEVIEELSEELFEFNPLVIVGDVKIAQKEAIINRFNENNSNCRLLIANISIGGRSISLHDLTGDYPRLTYIMPTYFINEQHQATFRTYRVGTVGEASVRFFYGITGQGDTESRLLTRIARAGKVMSDVMHEQGIIFPNDYQNEYEEKPEPTEEALV